MRAVVFAGPGRVALDEVPEPVIGSGHEAIVKVELASICGSDLHLLDGKTPGMREGSVIGHEYVGSVSSAGETAGVDVGDRVLGSFLIVCGECRHCVARRFNFCVNRRALGLGPLTGDLDGAQAEYVKVPDARLNLKRLDGPLSDLSNEQVLFAGDIQTTGSYAAALSEISDGDVVVVIGAGPVGLFCALACRLAGARVIVLDQAADRVAFARDQLHVEGIALTETEPSAEIAHLTNGAMADVVIDAVGAVPVVKTALKCVRDGGRITVVGVYGAERYELPMGVAWVRGIDIRFSGMANVQAHWDQSLEAVRSGAVSPAKLITHRLPLDEAVEGYELFRSRRAMKVTLQP